MDNMYHYTTTEQQIQKLKSQLLSYDGCTGATAAL